MDEVVFYNLDEGKNAIEFEMRNSEYFAVDFDTSQEAHQVFEVLDAFMGLKTDYIVQIVNKEMDYGLV